MTTISVITIAWNNLDGVRKTVKSVLAQTHPDIELLVIDGGSTDGTVEYLRTLPPEVRWVSERDNGRYHAMNKGAALAGGEYLWFMHSGDVFGSHTIVASVLGSIGDDTRWGFGLSRILAGGRVVGIFGAPTFSLRRFALGGKPISHQAVIIEKTLHEEIGAYDEQFGLAADQYYLLRAAMAAKPQIWCEFLCDFDSSGAGSTRGFSAHYRDMSRGRRLAHYRSTPSFLLDNAISTALALRNLLQRVFARGSRSATD